MPGDGVAILGENSMDHILILFGAALAGMVAVPLTLSGIDPQVLDVRVLTPLDLAVSKLGRFPDQEQADIAALACRGLIDATSVESRATEALGGYVGNTS